jgi:hypothetical protein
LLRCARNDEPGRARLAKSAPHFASQFSYKPTAKGVLFGDLFIFVLWRAFMSLKISSKSSFKLAAYLFGAAWLALIAGPLQAEVFRGQTSAGARYLIQTPDNWQPGRGLVIVNHGFQFDSNNSDPSLGPAALRNRMLSQGYALAASSYSTTGWATFTAETDLKQLIQAVERDLRTSIAGVGPIFLTGGSLGGLMSVQQAELMARGKIANLNSASGILSLCPPLAGSAVWDQAIDFRVSYDAICAESSNGRLPSGPAQAPWLLRASSVNDGGSTSAYADVVAAAASCIGFELPPVLVTSSMTQRKNKLMDATGAKEPFLGTLLFYSTFALSDLVYGKNKLGTLATAVNYRQPFDTRAIDLADIALNQSVRRLQAQPFDRFDLMRHYSPTGQIGSAKLLTISTSGDGLVAPEHLRYFEGILPANQWQRALVRESSPSHCGFNDAELISSWDQLRNWAGNQSANPPTVQSLNSTCAGGDCRFASAENLPRLDSVIKNRAANVNSTPIDGEINGDWYTPARNGEGIRIEAITGGRVLVNYFTYPLTGETSKQMWLTGVGEITPAGAQVDSLYRTEGAKFGAAFLSSDVRVTEFGSLSIVAQSCGNALMRFTDRAGNSQERAIVQLSRQRTPCFSRVQQRPETALSGNWYDPTRSGEGFTITVQNDLSTSYEYFTYTPDGKQAWLVGQAPISRDTNSRSFVGNGSLYLTEGARFGNDFKESDVRVTTFGNISLKFLNCNELMITYTTPWGQGSHRLVRIATPLGSEECSI